MGAARRLSLPTPPAPSGSEWRRAPGGGGVERFRNGNGQGAVERVVQPLKLFELTCYTLAARTHYALLCTPSDRFCAGMLAIGRVLAFSGLLLRTTRARASHGFRERPRDRLLARSAIDGVEAEVCP